MNILLATGSRLLVTNTAAMAAVGSILRGLMASSTQDLVLFAGDAKGPDREALDVATELRKASAVYCLDGIVRTAVYMKGKWWYDETQNWWNPKDPRPPSHRWPLARNRRMVETIEHTLLQGRLLATISGQEPWDRALCVGFVDPESGTRGTDHTLRLARQAGIWTARYVWQGGEFEATA